MNEAKKIYDELSKVLTDYEDMEGSCTEEDLYNMLVKIQNNWESIVKNNN